MGSWRRYGYRLVDGERRLTPTMPRIEQRIIGTSLYIYETRELAHTGSNSGGSGVLVGQPSRLSSSWVHLYAVTNAHVSDPGGIVARASTRSGETRIFAHDDWKPHPRNREDVAVCWLGTAPTGDDYELQWVPREWFITEQHLGLVAPQRDPLWASGPMTAGEETFSVARFIGFDGVERNQPVVRFGNLASSELLPIWQGTQRNRDQMSLLVEARSLAGASGAPVFAYRTGTTYGGGTTPVDNALLLGIGWGHIKHPRDEKSEFDVEMAAPGRPTAGRYNSGMMAVVPAWMIAELLDDPEVVAVREEREREMTAREGSTELDVATPDEEFRRFEDLTRTLVKVPKTKIDEKRTGDS